MSHTLTVGDTDLKQYIKQYYLWGNIQILCSAFMLGIYFKDRFQALFLWVSANYYYSTPANELLWIRDMEEGM